MMFLNIIFSSILWLSTFFIQSYSMVNISRQVAQVPFKKTYYIFCLFSLFGWDILALILSNFITHVYILAIIEFVLFYLSPIILYLALKKYYIVDKWLLLFLTLFIYLALNTFSDFTAILISSFVGDYLFDYLGPLFSVITSLLLYLFVLHINKIWKFSFDYFVDKQTVFKSLLKQSTFFLLLIHFIFVFSYSLGEIEHFNNFGSILETICFMSFFVLMFHIRGRREEYESQEELERQKKNQENLQSYTDKIVTLYNEVRGFRHDFSGMVTSLKISIDSGNLEEIKAIHREVLETANSHLGSESFTIFELNNIGDSALRSVLMDKAIKAESFDLNLTLDIKDYIDQLPVPMLDLIRMTNIIFDNALEGAYESHKKEVVISVIELPTQYVIVAKNSRKRQKLNLDDVYKVGYSTKGKRRGLGLPTVKKIIDSYDNTMLDTEISEDFFTQVISIDKKGMF